MAPEVDRLIEIVKCLREPQGCPWDRAQTHKSLLPYLIEEAYEFIEAVEREDTSHMLEELGDVLLQIILHSRIAQESGSFDINTVAGTLNAKLIRRHPHVFADTQVKDAEDVIRNWDQIKKNEKGDPGTASLLDSVPGGMPALLRAEKIQRRAARVGFDWPEIAPVLDKIEEEFAELRQDIEAGNDQHAQEELGDILFALVNLARHRRFSAEEALRATSEKFCRRFRFVEEQFLKDGRSMAGASLNEMDRYWEESKKVVG